MSSTYLKMSHSTQDRSQVRSPSLSRWTMELPWWAAGMLHADHQFRRISGRLHLPKLRAALQAHFIENVSPVSQNENKKVA